MVASFVDSTVLVDILRKHPPALSWLQSQSDLPGITTIAWMELIAGAQNKPAQADALKLLSRFNIEYLTRADMNWAMQRLLAYKLSHSVGILDCLIASISYRLQVPLYTHNLKHIAPVLGTRLTLKPY
jgi:predicted nucleic acid-binding protein